MQDFLFNDTYTGPRWRYAATLRPATPINLPRSHQEHLILLSGRTHPKYRHGTIDYAVELPESVTRHFDLVLIEKVEG